MQNQTRTDLLNYLNNNKIDYKFNKQDQSITVDLEVDQEDVMGDTCRNGKPWDKCNCC